MVKSLVGLQKTNNITSLISRYNEGSPSDSQFLNNSWLFLRRNLADTLSYCVPTLALSCEETVHYPAAAYSRYSSAYIGSKGSQNLIRV
jgi:hypothetical protein